MVNGLRTMVVAAVMLPTAASAQFGATCTPAAAAIHCRETAGSAAERANAANMERLRQMQGQNAGRIDFSDLEAANKAKLQKKISKAILEGRCDEAKAIALKAGDLDAADKAARLCTPPAS